MTPASSITGPEGGFTDARELLEPLEGRLITFSRDELSELEDVEALAFGYKLGVLSVRRMVDELAGRLHDGRPVDDDGQRLATSLLDDMPQVEEYLASLSDAVIWSNETARRTWLRLVLTKLNVVWTSDDRDPVAELWGVPERWGAPGLELWMTVRPRGLDRIAFGSSARRRSRARVASWIQR